MLNVVNVASMPKTQSQPHRSKTNTVKTPQIQTGQERPKDRMLKKTPKRP